MLWNSHKGYLCDLQNWGINVIPTIICSTKTSEMLTALEEQLNEQQWSTAAQFCDKLRFLKKLADEISQVEERLFEL